MKPLKVIIAEDHPHSLDVLIEFIHRFPEFDVIGHVLDGEQLVLQTLLHKPDIVVVDIGLPKLDGISAMKQCLIHHPLLKVIFVTGHKEFAIEAFEIQAIDYVVKPIKQARLLQALEHAKNRIIREQNSDVNSKGKKLYIRQESSHYYIPKEEILFFEKVNHKVLIHTPNQLFETPETLESFMHKLDSDFFRCHRSFIVNLQLIDSIKPSGNTFLAFFQDYDNPAFIAKTKLNQLRSRINIFTSNEPDD